MRLASKVLACLAAGAMLAACGGGSSPSGPTGRNVSYTGSTTALVISQSNVASLAAYANPSSTTSGTTTGPMLVGAASAGRPDVGGMMDFIRARSSDVAVALAGATGSATQACQGGGSETLSWSFASGTSNYYTSGDHTVISFAACNDGMGTVANGTARMDVVATTGGASPSVNPPAMVSGFTYGAKLTMTDFSVETPTGWVGMEGDVEMSRTWNSATFRLDESEKGSMLVIASGVGASVTLSARIAPLAGATLYGMSAATEYTDATAMTVSAEESGLNARMCSTEINGCINFETPVPVRQMASQIHPASGTVKLSDDAGRYIQVTPTDGATGAVTVSWELDLVPPDPDKTCATTWASMSTDACLK